MNNQVNDNKHEPELRQEQEEINELDEIFYEHEKVTTEVINKQKDLKIAPSSSMEEIKEFKDTIDDLDKTKGEGSSTKFINNLTEEEQFSLGLEFNSESYIFPDDLGKRKASPSIKNTPIINDKPAVMKDLVINKRVKSAKAGLMKLGQAVGIGPSIHVPLWHSGFWVTIIPLVDEDFINLELELISELKRVGKDTRTLGLSNYSILFADVIMKFFLSKIKDTSVQLDDGDDLLDFISINDINIIVTAMAKSIYPYGFQTVIPCKNTLQLDGELKPKCDYKARLKLNLNKLLWVDTSKLTVDQKAIMAKRIPNSATKEEIAEYQKTLHNNDPKTFNFIMDESTGTSVNVVIKTPTIRKYLEAGELFIAELRASTNEVIKNIRTTESAEDVEQTILKGYYLHLYNHYVDSIPVDDAIISEMGDINEALKTLTTNHEFAKKFMERIKEYIDESLIAVIGIPNFTCPVCEAKQETKSEIIPLSVYEYFFTLLHSKYEKILERVPTK